MLKVIVIYESKYGNTKLVAENIVEGMKEASKTEAILSEAKQVNFDDVISADAILIGSPNHWGGATGSISKFINKLGEINLNSKPAAVFDTYISHDFEKAVKKMEEQITEKVPSLKLVTPGLSMKVKGSKGPILEEELPKCREFGVKFGELIKG
ncbi:MAG: NAD(P)H-dependent oxidoreductase [Dehalococcoidales bacterium]|nr:NAD(P)H-dependent oxidoreductase [Dehalococcoidales bacterium]